MVRVEWAPADRPLLALIPEHGPGAAGYRLPSVGEPLHHVEDEFAGHVPEFVALGIPERTGNRVQLLPGHQPEHAVLRHLENLGHPVRPVLGTRALGADRAVNLPDPAG